MRTVRRRPRQAAAPASRRASGQAPVSNDGLLLPAPKLRRMIGISAVTLWRWRHDKKAGFPPAKSINGRLYFPWADVSAWIDRQKQAA